MNPSAPASGVHGNAKPTLSVASAVITSARLGRLRNGLPMVRMTNRTSVCVASDSTNQPDMEHRLDRHESTRKQHEERQEIEHRADRPDEQHEVADDPHVPSLRPAEEAVVHVVGRNRELGEVVEKVVEEDLRRQHRQERQEHRCRRHAEHVAEVRAGAHQQVLHHVAGRTPALEDAAMQHAEARARRE